METNNTVTCSCVPGYTDDTCGTGRDVCVYRYDLQVQTQNSIHNLFDLKVQNLYSENNLF